MMSPRPYDLTTYDGNRVDWLTRAALERAAELLGYPLTITQGSYNAGTVPASAGTHDGGGVVDLAPWDHERKVTVLRSVGFAAWFRDSTEGPWPDHIHAVLIGNERLSRAAENQVTAYLTGRNGLANNGPDTGTRAYVGRRFTWPEPNRTQVGRRRIRRGLRILDQIPAGTRPAVEAARDRIRLILSKMPKA